MPLLQRHVLYELVRVFLIALCVITAIFFLYGIIQELLEKGLGPWQIARLVPYLLPGALRNSIQGAILFAVCSVFGRMAANNELLAVNSLGIPSLAMVHPALLLAFLLSLVCVWLNDVRAWWSDDGIRGVVLESVEEIAYRALESERSYATGQIAIHVQGVEGRRLVHPTVTYWPRGEAAVVTISAESGRLRTNLADKTLSIVLHNGMAFAGQELTVAFPDTFEQIVPLSDASRDEPNWPAQNQSLRRLAGAIAHQRREVSRLAWSLASAAEEPASADSPGQTQATVPLPAEDSSIAGSATWNSNLQRLSEQQRLVVERRRLAKLESEPHKRWSSGFACLAFAMLGIPAAVRLRSGDYVTSFFMCFMPIVLVYQPLQFFCFDLAQVGRLPAWAPWLTNVALATAGAALMRGI
jgi:lipopolysaccharide export system permease protein